MNCSPSSVEEPHASTVEDAPLRILARIIARDILKNRRNLNELDRQAIQTIPAQG
jgi:hypothetical protein